jgi:chromosome segregation ATPase
MPLEEDKTLEIIKSLESKLEELSNLNAKEMKEKDQTIVRLSMEITERQITIASHNEEHEKTLEWMDDVSCMFKQKNREDTESYKLIKEKLRIVKEKLKSIEKILGDSEEIIESAEENCNDFKKSFEDYDEEYKAYKEKLKACKKRKHDDE